MSEKRITAFVGSTADDARVYVDMSIRYDGRQVETTEHEKTSTAIRLSASGFLIEKGRRQASSSGQILDDLANVSRPADGWTPRDIGSLLTLWRRWHLNDTRAGCAHMTLPEDESYDARKDITCPVVRVVKRDGKPVSPILADESEAFAWLLHHQSMSTDWALKHEGYSIESGYKYGQAWLYEQPPADAVAEWERLMNLPTGKVPTNY